MNSLAGFEIGKVHAADCLSAMAALPADSIDSIVTDPPYGLEFMGKEWDHGVPGVPFWQAALRVAKPGAHMLAFGGTRTFHRLACAIEDAGWEIRDCIGFLHGPLLWITGQGFPKSKNVGCLCGRKRLEREDENLSPEAVSGLRGGMAAAQPIPSDPEQDLRPAMRGAVNEPEQNGQASTATLAAPDGSLRDVREGSQAGIVAPETDIGSVLRPPLRGTSPGGNPDKIQRQHEGPQANRRSKGRRQPGVEGRSNLLSEARELQADKVCPVPGGVPADGPQGRLCNGASPDSGAVLGALSGAVGSGTSSQPRSAGQSAGEPATVPQQPSAQAGGRICPKCGGILDRVGWGSSLKPAFEPIIVARKPLDGTIAANVLKHGTGALNIDGCRIPAEKMVGYGGGTNRGSFGGFPNPNPNPNPGRWPANLVHDGSPEVLAGFPEEAGGGIVKPYKRVSKDYYSGAWPDSLRSRPTAGGGHDHGGSAARFFYCAKSSRSEREAGLEAAIPQPDAHNLSSNACARCGLRVKANGSGQKCECGELRETVKLPRARNHHPTVKPISLMRWLVRLVTPPGGIVLDPFAGSGSTFCAAVLEGFNPLGFDLEADYVAIANARIDYWRKHPEGPQYEPDAPAECKGQLDLFGDADGQI